jgi:hypothetical protein
MLHISHITKIPQGTQEWLDYKLGLFSSSQIGKLCNPKGFGEGGESYIYKKACEAITGKSDEKEYGFIEQLARGVRLEGEALRDYMDTFGVEYMITQQMIHEKGTMFCSSPDSIIPVDIVNDAEYIVETVETKCPQSYSEYTKQRMCDTPQQFKKEYPMYYWQVLDQMLVCGANIGHFYTYHPEFPEGNRGHRITFKKVPLWDDFTFLAKRKTEAVEMFNEVKQKLTQ